MPMPRPPPRRAAPCRGSSRCVIQPAANAAQDRAFPRAAMLRADRRSLTECPCITAPFWQSRPPLTLPPHPPPALLCQIAALVAQFVAISMVNRNGGLKSDVCQSATVPLELAAVSPAAPTAPPSVERGDAQPQNPVESATCPVVAVRRAAAAGTCLADGGESCVGPAHGACATALMEDLWPRVAAPDARPFLEAPTTPSSPPAWLAWLTARADAAKPRVPSEANLVLATLTGGAAAVGLFLWSWPTGFSIPPDAKEGDGAARTLVFVAGANLLAALASGLEAVGAVTQ